MENNNLNFTEKELLFIKRAELKITENSENDYTLEKIIITDRILRVLNFVTIMQEKLNLHDIIEIKILNQIGSYKIKINFIV